MVEPLRHRQTKEAETDIFDLKPPRHTSTLPWSCETRWREDLIEWIIFSIANFAAKIVMRGGFRSMSNPPLGRHPRHFNLAIGSGIRRAVARCLSRPIFGS